MFRVHVEGKINFGGRKNFSPSVQDYPANMPQAAIAGMRGGQKVDK